MEWRSRRFDLRVVLTRHAAARMEEREIRLPVLHDVIETGEIKEKDARRLWIYKNVPARGDNLVCAAVVIDDVLVIKTVMVNWRLVED